MGLIKQAWITEHDVGLVTISLESKHVTERYMRVKVHEHEFPEVPSKNNPLRHTVVISLLDEEDLKKILNIICKQLGYEVQV